MIIAGAPQADATALGDTELGTSFVDFVAGARFQVGPNAIVSGAVNVPVNDASIRPEVVGTAAIEVFF